MIVVRKRRPRSIPRKPKPTPDDPEESKRFVAIAWPGWRSSALNGHHAAHRYVVGVVHTNRIEGFWSIFKRGVVGTFHEVSRKYMLLYIAEFQFRYNNRENADIFGEAIRGC